MIQFIPLMRIHHHLFLFFIDAFCERQGVDIFKGWHENQIAFHESYTMTLAYRLAETRMFEHASAQEFMNGIRQNDIRWMIEGIQLAPYCRLDLALMYSPCNLSFSEYRR